LFPREERNLFPGNAKTSVEGRDSFQKSAPRAGPERDKHLRAKTRIFEIMIASNFFRDDDGPSAYPTGPPNIREGKAGVAVLDFNASANSPVHLRNLVECVAEFLRARQPTNCPSLENRSVRRYFLRSGSTFQHRLTNTAARRVWNLREQQDHRARLGPAPGPSRSRDRDIEAINLGRIFCKGRRWLG